MTELHLTSPQPATRPYFRLFSVRLLWACIAGGYNRHLQRCDLAEIDDHMLHDLGLTREDVRRECAKSFWRL